MSCQCTDIPYSISPLLPIVHRLWHLVSSQSCWMYVRAGRPAFSWPYEGVHRSTSLMISSLLLQQCPACLVRLIWIVFVMGGRWSYSWCLVGCCRQDLFNIAPSMNNVIRTNYIKVKIDNTQNDWVGKVNPPEVVERIKIWTCWQMVSAQINTCASKWDINFSRILRFRWIMKCQSED